MKEVKINSLGFTALAYMVAATAAEYDQLAKKEGACVDSANNNTLYRSTLAEFRNNFLHGVDAVGEPGDEKYKAGIPGIEQITKIERTTKETGRFRGEGEAKEPIVVWGETESDYYKRAMAQLVKDQTAVELNDDIVGPFASVEAAQAAFAPLAQSHLDAIPFDPSETEKAPAGPKKVAKVYIEVAKKLIAAGKAEGAAASLSGVLGITVHTDEESLGRAIAEDQRRKREAVGAEYGV